LKAEDKENKEVDIEDETREYITKVLDKE